MNRLRIDPLTLPGLYAWYDAGWINGFNQAPPAADAAISQWNDLSGNGRHAVQATGANQPLYRASSGPNGFPCVNFVDNTDTMQFASATVIPRPITMLMVVRNTVADDANYHHTAIFNNQQIGGGLDWSGANNVYTLFDNAAIMTGGTVPGDTTAWHVLSIAAQPAGKTTVGSVDGVHYTASGVTGTNTNSNIDLSRGGVNSWIGLMAEVLVFTGELSPPVMFALEQALCEKWSIFSTYRLQA